MLFDRLPDTFLRHQLPEQGDDLPVQGEGIEVVRVPRAGLQRLADPREALVGLGQEYKLELDASQSRRNLLTEGVPLNHLVGKEFRVGSVRLKGVELCEPCGHLEKLTIKGVKKGLGHRGGLRAQIVAGGTLRVGDTVVPG